MIKNIIIIIGILILVGLGLFFVMSMTGNVIGSVVSGEAVVHNDYFKISDFGDSLNDSVDKVEDVIVDIKKGVRK